MSNVFDAVPASADFILEVIRDSHRQQSRFDPEADPSAHLTFDTTVAEWRDACDLIRTDDLGVALTEIWEISVPLEEWRKVLLPAKAKTLRDVCDLVSRHAGRLEMRPAGAFGTSCKAADAFLAVRGLLLRAGVPPSSVRPSLPVAEVARRYPAVFLGPISRLAPGRLPAVTVRSPLDQMASWTAIGGFVGAVAIASHYPVLALGSLAVFVVAVVATRVCTRVPPREVRFGHIVTFRDLAEAIVHEPA